MRDFVAAAFDAAGVREWQPFVLTDPRFVRAVDSASLVGDASRARERTGWTASLGGADVARELVARALQRVGPPSG